ncbi:MAG: LamG domain-containing protein, partial [Planctomycetaceae bacterium]|nr:LamG domain-containing protein [Planctomycetaceae bacterium]
RDFRLGVFSDFEFWNPKKIKWDDIAVPDRPMVVVKQPPFSRDQWTHVVFTFDNVNATTDKASTAILYVNGKQHGTVKRPMRFTWTKSTDGTSEAMIMLGINYVGDMDELKIYKRALTADEVLQLFQNP